MKWKSKLLSSGLPLEQEAINRLHKLGFYVDGELPYTRYGLNEHTDGSIDVSAHAYLPDGDDFSAQLIALVECKYRHDEKVWLFTNDPNNDPDFSPSSPHGLRSFSSLTTYNYDQKSLLQLCCEPPSVLKGMELNLKSGEAQDKDIKHAVNQLRYALPTTLLKYAFVNGNCHPEDSQPFFILPILVTNAELRVASDNFSIQVSRDANSLDDFSEKVDWVDLYSGYTDSFKFHCKKVFNGIGDDDIFRSEGPYELLHNSLNKKTRTLTSPLSELQRLERGQPLFASHNMYNQFWVCNMEAFEGVVQKAITAVTLAMKDSSIKDKSWLAQSMTPENEKKLRAEFNLPN